MSDSSWNNLPEELQSLGQQPPETPIDPVAFKERVLREYERRTRWHLRESWLRHGILAVGVGVAAWLGVLIVQPALSTQKSAVPPVHDTGQQATLSKQEVVARYFDLLLQKRPTLAEAYLAKALRGQKQVVEPNRTRPHMTGYRIQALTENSYEVALSWATYGAEAWVELLHVSVVQEEGAWVIQAITEQERHTFASHDQGSVVAERASAGSDAHETARANLPSKNGWGFFAVDPTEVNRVALAQQGDRPQVYVWQEGQRAPKQVATLPEGEIGELLWGDNGLLLANFSPQSNLKKQELWWIDTVSGKVYQDAWLEQQCTQLHMTHAVALHLLAGNRVELQSGTRMFWADLTKQVWTEEDVPPLQSAEVAYEASQVANLPTDELRFFDADQAASWVSRSNIPSDKRIDPTREVGYYLLNGSMESLTLVSDQLQVEVSHDPGHLQVLRIPYAKLEQSGLSGKRLRIGVYDESGTPLAEETEVKVP